MKHDQNMEELAGYCKKHKTGINLKPEILFFIVVFVYNV